MSISGFNLVIERLLISGQAWDREYPLSPGFNLVIERLLISGQPSVIELR